MALSRMEAFVNKTFKDEKGNLKQGDEYRKLYQQFGFQEIGVVVRWSDGRLHDDGPLPAVEFMDAHIEHFKNGFLHNERTDEEGRLQPAIIANYGKNFEYYLDGKEVKQPKKSQAA